MPKNELARLTEMVDALTRGELAADALTPDFELHQSSSIIDTAGVFHGPEGVFEAMRELHGSFDELRFEVEETHEAPDGRLVALIRARGRGRGSSVETSNPIAWVFTRRDGRFARMEVFEERGDALEATGLSAPGPNEALIRRAYDEGYANRTVESLRGSVADDFQFHMRAGWPGRPTYGFDEMTQAWADLDDTFTEFQLAPTGFVSAGEFVIATLRQSARMRGSEARIEATIWHVWRVVDGLVREAWVFDEHDDALRAAGMHPKE